MAKAFIILFKKQKNRSTDLTAFEKVCISFSAYNQYTIHWCIRRGIIFIILGTDYQKALDYLTREAIGPELDTFGTVVSEKNRVEIMNYIESARVEYNKGDYNHERYRKTILDVHDLIDKLPEIDNE